MRRRNEEESILRQLDHAIRQPRAAKLLAAIADHVDQSLESDANTRLVMGDGNWVVVSFHTARDDELIEGRPADDAHPDIGATRSELYEGRAAR